MELAILPKRLTKERKDYQRVDGVGSPEILVQDLGYALGTSAKKHNN